ncbi:hypothetical protein ACUX4R_25705, partial [Salmonella enterica]
IQTDVLVISRWSSLLLNERVRRSPFLCIYLAIAVCDAKIWISTVNGHKPPAKAEPIKLPAISEGESEYRL